MRYLIDGYNLAHQATLRAGRVSSAELELARDKLLQMLAKALGDQAGQATVVFDARRTRGIPAQETRYDIDVRYALDEESDDVIERLIRAQSAPKQLTVVSDDHRLQTAARRRGCVSLGCQDFLDLLERPATPSRAVAEEKPSALEDVADWEKAFALPVQRSKNGRRGR